MKRVLIAVATAAFVAVPSAALAQETEPDDEVEAPVEDDDDEYVEVEPPPVETPDDPRIDVTGFTTVCIADAPFIEYEILLEGLEWPGSATLTFTDVNGNPVSGVGALDQVVVTEPAGRVIFPGSDWDGTQGTDWPGWRQTPDGRWEPDPTDAILRQGVNVLVEVNPEASVLVTYPPATEVCADPPEVGVLPPPTPQRPLPSAGLSTLETSLRLAALLMVGGLGVVIIARRRRISASPAPVG